MLTKQFFDTVKPVYNGHSLDPKKVAVFIGDECEEVFQLK
jgi:hypothetical protein